MQGIGHLRHVGETRAIRITALMILLSNRSVPQKASEPLAVRNKELKTRFERQRVSLETEEWQRRSMTSPDQKG